MLVDLRNTVLEELRDIIKLKKARPYTFRTRLERALVRITVLADTYSNEDLKVNCLDLKNKLGYISDHSNQTSDGTLKSFIHLEPEIEKIYRKVSSL